MSVYLGRAVVSTARPCVHCGMFGRLLEVQTRYKTRYIKVPMYTTFFENRQKRGYTGVTPFLK